LLNSIKNSYVLLFCVRGEEAECIRGVYGNGVLIRVRQLFVI